MTLALAVVVLAVALGAAAVAYQQIGLRRDRRRWPVPGKLVEAGNGLRLHLLEAGEGEPTVILESGIAATILNWRAVQSRVAQFTRVVSYDRAGLGFSGGARTARTPSNIVEELRYALSRAGIPPPYVLVGHSFGGLVMRWFALRYPQEVGALILIDALRPEDWTPLSDHQRRLLRRGVMLLGRGRTLARVGVVRLCLSALMAGSRMLPRVVGRAASGSGASVMDRIAGEIGKMPREVWPVIAAHWSNPSSFAGLRAYLRDLPPAIAPLRGAPP